MQKVFRQLWRCALPARPDVHRRRRQQQQQRRRRRRRRRVPRNSRRSSPLGRGSTLGPVARLNVAHDCRVPFAQTIDLLILALFKVN